MNKFFTHPMRPFFVGAAVLAILGALVFFISPDAVILHRQIFLELMLPAAYGGFLTAAMLEWTGYKGRLKPVATLMAALLLAASVLLPFCDANLFVFRRRLLAGVAAFLRLADLARPQHRQLCPANVTCRVHRFSDGLCRQRRFEPVARASASEHGGGHVCIRPRQCPFGRGSP